MSVIQNTGPLPSPGPPAGALCQAKLPDLPSSLEALINDCFQNAMDPESLAPGRSEYVARFHKYLYDCHSHENLAFLMEIFRYEYFYERLEKSHSLEKPVPDKPVSGSLVDKSLEQFIDSLPYPTRSMSRHLRRGSVKSHSNVSIASSTGAPFPLEFDEAVDSHEAWNLFSARHLDSDSDAESLVNADEASPSDAVGAECAVSPTSTNSANCPELLLADQWHYIVATFIVPRSECQINLSNKTYRALMDMNENFEQKTKAEAGDNQNQTVSAPCPVVLMDAKAEVMRLIHENTYHPFTKKMRNCPALSCDCSTTGSPHSSGAASPLSAGPTPTSPFPRNSTPSSLNSRPETPLSGQSVPLYKSEIATVAPVPQKRRSKFLQTFSGNASSSSDVGSSPSNTLSSIITHLKPHGSNYLSRSFNSAPQSPIPTSTTPARGMSPLSQFGPDDILPRAQSTVVPDGHQSPSILGKLWRKRR